MDGRIDYDRDMQPNLSLMLPLLAIASGSSCADGPDLVVSDQTVTWNPLQRSATTRIDNIGNADAGQFLVYVNGDEVPTSQNHRPQVSHVVNGLPAGGHVEIVSDFLPLAHEDNRGLTNVQRIRAILAPKNAVGETNEDNNERVTLAPVSCTTVTSCLAPGDSGSVGMTQVSAYFEWSIFPVPPFLRSTFARQTFTVPAYGRLCGIEVSVDRGTAQPSQSLILKVGKGAQDLGTSTKLATEVPGHIGGQAPPLDPVALGPGHFDLSSSQILLEPGSNHDYWFELSSAPSLGQSGFVQGSYFLIRNCADDYPGGRLQIRSHLFEQWVPEDLSFKILMR